MKPKQTLTKFMQCWKDQDFEKMKDYCVLQWHRESAQEQLSFMFDKRKIKGFKVDKAVLTKEETHAIIPVYIEYENGSKSTVKVVCQCETAPQVFNVHGNWGVNVASFIG